MHYLSINANTPQPRYSRVYVAYRSGSEVNLTRTSFANSSLGLAQAIGAW
jgi:hypothetical protein